MNYDEFAFFNQQLAAMLRSGIPLEGALRQLCADMRQGSLKAGLQALEADLIRGVPLAQAVLTAPLPELYRHLVEIGVQSNDLPGMLTLLADYYQRRNTIWTRLKGIMVYPTIVLCGSFMLSCFLAFLLSSFIWPSFGQIVGAFSNPPVTIGIWTAPVVLAVVCLALGVALGVAPLRRKLRWKFPAFKESSLAQVASAMSLMLRSGVPLDKALALVERLEQGTPAGLELAEWRRRLAAGHGKFSDLAQSGRAFPPLFIWLVAGSSEKLAEGFHRAADIYQGRATYRAELLLYSALPCSVLLLGALIMSQIQPVFSALIAFMNAIGSVGD